MDLFGDLPPPSEDEGKKHKTGEGKFQLPAQADASFLSLPGAAGSSSLFGDLPPSEASDVAAAGLTAGTKRDTRDPLDANSPPPKLTKLSGI